MGWPERSCACARCPCPAWCQPGATALSQGSVGSRLLAGVGPCRHWKLSCASRAMAAPYLVLRGHDVPGTGDSRGVVPLWPVGRVEGARGLLQSSPAVLVPCNAAQRAALSTAGAAAAPQLLQGLAEGARPPLTQPHHRHGRAPRLSWGHLWENTVNKGQQNREKEAFLRTLGLEEQEKPEVLEEPSPQPMGQRWWGWQAFPKELQPVECS